MAGPGLLVKVFLSTSSFPNTFQAKCTLFLAALSGCSGSKVVNSQESDWAPLGRVTWKAQLLLVEKRIVIACSPSCRDEGGLGVLSVYDRDARSMGSCALELIIYHSGDWGGGGAGGSPSCGLQVWLRRPRECHWLPPCGHDGSHSSGHVALSQVREYGATWVACGFMDQNTEATRGVPPKHFQ